MYDQIHELTVSRLSALYDKEQAHAIAWWLLEALTGMSRTQLMMSEWHISNEQQVTLAQWLDDHINAHKPLAYIIGSVPFCDISIAVTPPVLIPRSETEEWVTSFINELRASGITTFSLLDMCTGSGCIALAIAHAFPQATIYASDIDPRALACARTNAERNAITNVIFVASDLFAAFSGKQFNFILSNPPYIAHDEAASLAPSVREWESEQALFADDEGYALIKCIISQAPSYLKLSLHSAQSSVPTLLIEIGYRQGALVSAYMKEYGYSNVRIQKDYAGHDRVVCGRYDNEGTSTDNE